MSYRHNFLVLSYLEKSHIDIIYKQQRPALNKEISSFLVCFLMTVLGTVNHLFYTVNPRYLDFGYLE